ncbi:MAG: hypothetical protein PHQ32_00485 [Firmicutes bacterium]|nr:hypothetical protein [Bacillota bacterium]
MNEYILEHEAYIKGILEKNDKQDWNSIKEYHKVQIMFMQHERLVHMIVTLFFGLFLSISLGLALLFNMSLLFLLVFIIGIIEVFYMVHLYRLENGVQRWYVLYNELSRKADEQK